MLKTLGVDSVTLDVDVEVAVAVLVARDGLEAVDTLLTVVAVEKVTGTEVVSVATGLKVKSPILFPISSVK